MKKRTTCEVEGTHACGVLTSVVGNVLFQLTCPRCGEFVLMTQSDLEKAIVSALAKGGRYTNIERIA